MKKFIRKLLLFALLVFLIDKAFILVRNASPYFDYDKRLEMVLNGRVNKDVIIMGSSKGQTDIYTQMLADSLGLEVFNLAWNGSSPENQDFILDKLLEHNKKPKYIIKVIDDDFELMSTSEATPRDFRVDRLYPLVKYPEIRNELIRRGDKSKILSNLFVLHQLNRSNFDFRKPPKHTIKDTIYGNDVFSRKHKESLDWNYKESSEYDSSKEDEVERYHFEKFQKTCEDNHIQLILVTAPIYKEPSKSWINRMSDLSLPSTLIHVHNIEDIRYKDKLNYSDQYHLNYLGATILTQELIQYLRAETDIQEQAD